MDAVKAQARRRLTVVACAALIFISACSVDFRCCTWRRSTSGSRRHRSTPDGPTMMHHHSGTVRRSRRSGPGRAPRGDSHIQRGRLEPCTPALRISYSRTRPPTLRPPPPGRFDAPYRPRKTPLDTKRLRSALAVGQDHRYEVPQLRCVRVARSPPTSRPDRALAGDGGDRSWLRRLESSVATEPPARAAGPGSPAVDSSTVDRCRPRGSRETAVSTPARMTALEVP